MQVVERERDAVLIPGSFHYELCVGRLADELLNLADWTAMITFAISRIARMPSLRN
jgi:hypothetical protein